MNQYNHTISIRLPMGLAGIAAAIGRALDSDTGGDKSFVLDADGLTISTSAPCTSEFYTQAQYMLLYPEALHAAVAADYAARWGELAAPTLDECALFCESITPASITPVSIPTILLGNEV